MCINQGKGTAVKVLQRAVNSKGGDLKVDGGLGPKTIEAINKYKPCDNRTRCYRLKHYYDLVNKKVYLYHNAKVTYGNVNLTAAYIELDSDKNTVFCHWTQR